MERIGFSLHIRPGSEQIYQKRRQQVYPELLAAFREVVIHTYSIFMQGTTLFAYMEIHDFGQAMPSHGTFGPTPSQSKMAQAFMSDILVTDEEGQSMCPLPEVFHFPERPPVD